MKTLVVFYSRTGTTKKVAKTISKNLKCDCEEIIDLKDRSGAKGYIISGKDATFNKLTKIKKPKKNVSSYDLVIIGTPVWALTMSTPVRTFILENKDKFKKVAFFSTMNGFGSAKTFKNLKELINKKPIAKLSLLTLEVVTNKYDKQVEKFIQEIIKIC